MLQMVFLLFQVSLLQVLSNIYHYIQFDNVLVNQSEHYRTTCSILQDIWILLLEGAFPPIILFFSLSLRVGLNWRVEVDFFYLLLGCSTANLESLSRGQPHSSNVNLCIHLISTWRSLGASQRGWAPKPDQVPNGRNLSKQF